MNPNTVERYEVLFNGRPIARGYASVDIKRRGFKNVSVLPIDRSVDEDGVPMVSLPELITGGYPATESTREALYELLGIAKIEATKVTIRDLSPAERR